MDNELCWLVDRLRGMGYYHTIEVELRLGKLGQSDIYHGDDPGGYDFTQFLPRFREKGVVTILDYPDPITFPGDPMSKHCNFLNWPY